MAHFYKFAIVRMAPKNARDERINVGLVVVTEAGLDVYASKRLDRVRALSQAVDPIEVRDLVVGLRSFDERLRDAGVASETERLKMLSQVGPLSLSNTGTFVANDADAYDRRVATILREMVEPEPAPSQAREKRSKLLTQMKKTFRGARVLAQSGEDLGSHRIVPKVRLDEGMIADLVLKNGAYHVVETVDAASQNETARKALGDIGISALVLERARQMYGPSATTRLVYSASATLERVARPSLEIVEAQGATLVNWASADDRNIFVHYMTSLAEPAPRKSRKRRGVTVEPGQTRFI